MTCNDGTPVTQKRRNVKKGWKPNIVEDEEDYAGTVIATMGNRSSISDITNIMLSQVERTKHNTETTKRND